MRQAILFALCAFALGTILGASAARAGEGRVDEMIQSAMSAAPASISAEAMIMSWKFEVLRPGSNGWTCMPDRPSPGNSPWCVTEQWLNLLRAKMKREKPTYHGIGIAYMLQGDAPVSNSDPFAAGPTGPGDWVEDPGPHLMILVADLGLLEGLPADFRNGGPWVMWAGTPYAHIMVPLEGPRPN
jgi:hypothetical protein